jgi:hypothetical protein
LEVVVLGGSGFYVDLRVIMDVMRSRDRRQWITGSTVPGEEEMGISKVFVAFKEGAGTAHG